MAQVFPRWLNRAPLALAGAGGLVSVFAVCTVWLFFSPRHTQVGYRPEQPVPYSHRLHVGELGLDCRYCHVSVETSPIANVPPTQVCLNCHRVVGRESAKLAPIRDSAARGQPMRWVRVHKLPEYVYFDHHAHVRAGVGCASCHGRVDQMEVVIQVEPLSMGWCLDCHRNPAPHLRPVSRVTDMKWVVPPDNGAFAAKVRRERGLAPPLSCTGCHR